MSARLTVAYALWAVVMFALGRAAPAAVLPVMAALTALAAGFEFAAERDQRRRDAEFHARLAELLAKADHSQPPGSP